MITKYCTKCGSKWLVSNPNASECPKCDGALRGETNGDKIRSMTDEELAKWLCNNMDCPICPGDSFCEVCGGLSNGLVKWLKQEAT